MELSFEYNEYSNLMAEIYCKHLPEFSHSLLDFHALDSPWISSASASIKTIRFVGPIVDQSQPKTYNHLTMAMIWFWIDLFFFFYL